MCAVLMFRPIGRIGECLGTSREFTHVGLLPGVRPQVSLEVLKAGIGFTAALELQTNTTNTPYIREVITCTEI